MLKLVELGKYHNSKGGVYEMASDRCSRLETLHWSDSYSSLFIEKYSNSILIDGTHKTNVYDLSLVVATVATPFGVSIPVVFLVIPSKNSSSIESILDLLRIGSNSSPDLSGNTCCSIITNEGSDLVKMASSMSGYNHCMSSFYVIQLAVRVSLLI